MVSVVSVSSQLYTIYASSNDDYDRESTGYKLFPCRVLKSILRYKPHKVYICLLKLFARFAEENVKVCGSAGIGVVGMTTVHGRATLATCVGWKWRVRGTDAFTSVLCGFLWVVWKVRQCRWHMDLPA